MLAQRRPDDQDYVGPTSVSNVGPTESTTEKLRWPNVVMLSGLKSVLELGWIERHYDKYTATNSVWLLNHSC